MPSILFEEQEIILLGKKPSVGKEPSSLVFPAAKADGDEKLVYFNISDRTSRFKKNQNGFCADSMLGLGTADVLVAASDEKVTQGHWPVPPAMLHSQRGRKSPVRWGQGQILA